ncbi:MAG: GNAT family protein [Bacteroidota bacterium]
MPIRRALRPFFFKPAPELTVSEDILLQSLKPSDSAALYLLVEENREHLEAWLTWITQIQSLEDTQRFIRQVSYRDIFRGRWVYAVRFQDKIVGLIDFNEGDRELNQVSIGYWLGEQAQGKGIITRSVTTCLDYCFKEQQLHKVLIKCASHNEKSIAVPMRLNFQWEAIEREAGEVNGQIVDLMVYGMTYRDWRYAE